MPTTAWTIPFDIPGSSMGARKPITHRTAPPPDTHQIIGFRLIRAAGPRNIVPPTFPLLSRMYRELTLGWHGVVGGAMANGDSLPRCGRELILTADLRARAVRG